MQSILVKYFLKEEDKVEESEIFCDIGFESENLRNTAHVNSSQVEIHRESAQFILYFWLDEPFMICGSQDAPMQGTTKP